MTELGSLLADTVAKLFGALATKELIESAEQGAWPEKLWRALEEGGGDPGLQAEALQPRKSVAQPNWRKRTRPRGLTRP